MSSSYVLWIKRGSKEEIPPGLNIPLAYNLPAYQVAAIDVEVGCSGSSKVSPSSHVYNQAKSCSLWY